MFSLKHATAYTPTAGVQLNDNVTMELEGTKPDGTVFQPFTTTSFTISYDGLIEGFVDGVLGMKIGESKTFDVPPDKGYQSGELAGITLTFHVKILSVAGYTDETGNNQITTNNALDTIIKVFVGTGATIAAIYIAVVLYNLISRQTGLKCDTCGKPAAGTCSSCGHPFCRTHFTGRCPNCGGKKFIPKKE